MSESMTQDKAIEILNEMLPKLSAYRSDLMSGEHPSMRADNTMDVHWYEAVTVLLLDIYDVRHRGLK